MGISTQGAYLVKPEALQGNHINCEVCIRHRKTPFFAGLLSEAASLLSGANSAFLGSPLLLVSDLHELLVSHAFTKT